MTDLVGMPPPPLSPTPSPEPGLSPDDKNWAVVAHASAFFAPFLVPLFIYFTKAKESSWVRSQTVEVLNFHITVVVLYAISGVASCFLIGLVLLPLVYLGSIALALVGIMKAYKGESYQYPLTIRIIQ